MASTSTAPAGNFFDTPVAPATPPAGGSFFDSPTPTTPQTGSGFFDSATPAPAPVPIANATNGGFGVLQSSENAPAPATDFFSAIEPKATPTAKTPVLSTIESQAQKTPAQIDALGNALSTNEKNFGQGITSRLVLANQTPLSDVNGIPNKTGLLVAKAVSYLVNKATSGESITNPITNVNGKAAPTPASPGIITQKTQQLNQLDQNRKAFTDQVNSTMQQIRVRRAAGLDTTQQEEQLKNVVASNPGYIDSIIPGISESNKQIAGAGLGTALDVGTLAVGAPEFADALDVIKAGKVTEGTAQAAKVLQSTNDAFKAGVAIRDITNAQKIAAGVAHLAEGAATGYGYDVANNLQQGKTGADAFKPGLGSIIGSSLGSLPGALDLLGAGKELYNSLTPAERQGGFIRNPLSMFDDDTQNIGNALKAKGISEEDFIRQMDDPTNEDAAENLKANLAMHDMSPDEFYQRAMQDRDVAPKIKSLPFTQAEYNDFLDKLGITDEDYKNTLMKQGFDGVQLKDETPESTFEPRTFYHGTSSDVEAKDLKPTLGNMSRYAGMKDDALFLSDNKEVADSFGKNAGYKVINEETKNIGSKTYGLSELSQLNLKEFDTRADGIEGYSQALKDGYDGIKFPEMEGNTIAISKDGLEKLSITDSGSEGINKVNSALERAKNGEDFGPRTSKGELSSSVEEKSRPKQVDETRQQNNEPEKQTRVAERKAALEEGMAKARSESEAKADLRAKQTQEILKQDKPLKFWQKIQNKLFPLKYMDEETADAFREWNGARKKAPILAEREMGQINVPRGDGLDVIMKYQSSKDTIYNSKIKEVFDGLYNEAKERGFDPGFRENYIPQVYKESSAEIKAVVREYLEGKGMSPQDIDLYLEGSSRATASASNLGLTPFFQKERIFPDYKTAMEWGLTPRFTDPDQLAAYYRDQLEKNIANKNLIDHLTSTGKLIPEQIAPRDMVPVRYLPMGQRGYYADPKLADMLDGMFKGDDDLSPLGTFAKTFAGVSRLTQQIALSAGVPMTDINFYTIGQVIKELTAGNYKVLPAFLRANFTDASIKFFTENSEYAEKLAGTGFDIGNRVGTYGNVYDNWTNKFREAVNNAKAPGALGKIQTYKNFASLAGDAFDKLFSEKTFGSFMPQMYLQGFKDEYLSLIKSGASEEEATEIAGQITKKMAGVVENVGRSKTTQDLLSSVLFAPKFRESMVNVLWNSGEAGVDFLKQLGGLRGQLDPALTRNRKLLAGMLLTFGAYNAVNYKLNGNFMWDNPAGHQFDLRIQGKNGNITYIPFMPSFLTVARNLGSAAISLGQGNFPSGVASLGQNLSEPLQITMSLIGNQTYAGDPIYKTTDTTSQKLRKLAAYTGLELNHPYIKAIVNQIKSKKPIGEFINNMLELPLKFGTSTQENTNAFFNALDEETRENSKLDNQVKPIYQHVQSLVQQGDTIQAQQIVDGLSDEQYSAYKRVKDSDDTKLTEKGEEAMFPTVLQVRKLISDGQTDQAQALINAMSDDQYKDYKLVKAKLPASEQY